MLSDIFYFSSMVTNLLLREELFAFVFNTVFSGILFVLHRQTKC